jgi:hypothetical protein
MRGGEMTVKTRTIIEFTRAPYIIDNKGITREDWKGLDIQHPDVWFNAGNQYKVDATDLPKEVVDYFRSDSDFKVTEEKAE